MSAATRAVGGMRLMELHALALEEGLDEDAVDVAMDGDDPRAALLVLLQPRPAMGAEAPPSEAATIAAALAHDSAGEREAAYDAIDGAVKEKNLALVVACARPLIQSVLCAPLSRVGAEEWRRAALLLYEMTKVDDVAVLGEMCRKDDQGDPLHSTIFSAPGTVLTVMLAKEPSEWDRDDALTMAASLAVWVSLFAAGFTAAVIAMVEVSEMELFGSLGKHCPWIGEAYPPDHFASLALLCMELVRSEIDDQPEALIAGAACCCSSVSSRHPGVGKALFEAGFLDIYEDTLQRYNPIERISKRDLIPCMVLGASRDVMEGAQIGGVDVTPALVRAGVIEAAVGSLTAYQMLGRPEDVAINALQWGGVYMLEVLMSDVESAPIVAAKLRSAGVDIFRYLLDNPLVLLADLGWETSIHATKVAALVRCLPLLAPALPSTMLRLITSAF